MYRIPVHKCHKILFYEDELKRCIYDDDILMSNGLDLGFLVHDFHRASLIWDFCKCRTLFLYKQKQCEAIKPNYHALRSLVSLFLYCTHLFSPYITYNLISFFGHLQIVVMYGSQSLFWFSKTNKLYNFKAYFGCWKKRKQEKGRDMITSFCLA